MGDDCNLLVVLAAWEWVRYIYARPPNPLLVSVAALGLVAFAVWRYVKWWPQLKALRLGIEGERVVGEYLERMRDKGFRVFHDVVAEGFNLDHVLVGPTGVYTIETKTRSKPSRGDARVQYDGAVLTVAGFEPDRDAIAQAKGQARWLSTLIADTTERRVAVRPWSSSQVGTSMQARGVNPRCGSWSPRACPRSSARSHRHWRRRTLH